MSQIPEYEKADDLSSEDLIGVSIDDKPPCGYRSDCGGFCCAWQPKVQAAIFDDLIESGADQMIADYLECARDAHAAAVSLSFDPHDLIGLDPSAMAHALATRKDIDPNCRVVLEILERTRKEFWAPWAASHLERLRRKSADENQPLLRKRKGKKVEDASLRLNLFRDFGVELPSSSRPSTARPSKVPKRVPRKQSQGIMQVDLASPVDVLTSTLVAADSGLVQLD